MAPEGAEVREVLLEEVLSWAVLALELVELAELEVDEELTLELAAAVAESDEDELP